MKIGIIYHSGTGTTARLAQEIKSGFEEKGNAVQIFRIPKFRIEDIEDFDILGIGTPTMGFRTPSFVMDFIKLFPTKNQPYFLFNTCSGTLVNTFSRIYRHLKKKNWKLLDVLSLKGQGTTNIKAWRPKITEELSKMDGIAESEFEKAKQFTSSILENYTQIIQEKTSPAKTVKLKYLMTVMFLLSDNLLAKGTIGKKVVNLERCTKCGLCATKICPSGCITLNSESIPEFNEKLCISCQGCVNLCPELAITGKGKKNYPYTTYNKYIIQS
ncbi:EFR1 family ferrodoxin [Promethearchaeum syntrophicum]|uniref:EFR1 family ferrodoxin n=1 Tax=Promethearchaeum syntrophicum TaxID=2594042 RepID=A0A5B9DCG9_9ARCH|nr:EFR1 family ferrodoxin [Candidatus Prometheoarchaeum syntrophicum]QEE16908.1 flavodoxin [Candidatus Prometheoarchaeum syntrophicum]